MNIEFDMYQTLALAVLVLLLGSFLKKHIHFLEKFCIPAPVIGGLLFAILTCIGYSTGLADFTFDDTLREVCMVFFFTSVGFQANLKVLKSGGKSMIIFLFLVITLIVSQNLLACSWSFQTAAIKSACRYVYRINSNGRRPRYCRCLWTGFGGF